MMELGVLCLNGTSFTLIPLFNLKKFGSANLMGEFKLFASHVRRRFSPLTQRASLK